MRKFLAFLSVGIISILSFQLSIVKAAAPFPDVEESYAYVNAIEYLKEKGVITGYEDNTFKPNKEISRAEFLKMAVGALEAVTPFSTVYNDCFSDVKEEWFAPYVCYALKKGWIQGYDDGSFKPHNTISRKESIKMLASIASYYIYPVVDEAPYPDVEPGTWVSRYARVAKEKGLIPTGDGKFYPDELMTRGTITESLYRAMVIAKSGHTSFGEYLKSLE